MWFLSALNHQSRYVGKLKSSNLEYLQQNKINLCLMSKSARPARNNLLWKWCDFLADLSTAIISKSECCALNRPKLDTLMFPLWSATFCIDACFFDLVVSFQCLLRFTSSNCFISLARIFVLMIRLLTSL